MNVDEYGLVFAFNTSFDLSAQTSLSLTFTKPDNSTLTVTSSGSDLAVGSGPLTAEDGTVYADGEYVTYTIQDGDIDQEGEWQARVTYNDAAGQHLISDVGTFTVDP